MHIVFVGTEAGEKAGFTEKLPGHDLQFVAELADVGQEAEVLSVFIHSKVDRAFLEAHPELRFIATRSTGHDHIDLEECGRRNIAVSYVPSYGESTVAEHTMALILALSRRLIEATQARPGFTYEDIRGFDLKGKTLGIIGSGRIGLHVLRLAAAFDMKLLAYDPQPQRFMEEILGFRYVALDELLADSDIISLHAPLLPETYHILNRESFAKCRHGVIIINTARGALIDTEALVEALDSGKVAGAGLDVLQDESVLQEEALDIIGDQIVERLHATRSREELRSQNPERIQELAGLMRNSDLVKRSNVVFTPHVAFNSVEAVGRINETTAENICAFLAGSAVNLVPATQ